MLPFEVAEYRLRLTKTKERMQQAGIDVLLVTDPANMNYLTGYDGWSFYVHQGLLVVADRDEPMWFGRQQDSNGARLTTWLDAQNVRGYTDDYVQSDIKHPMDFAADLLAELNCLKRSLGVEMDHYYSALDQVLRADVYISSMGVKEEMNSVYREFFPVDPPARNCVAVAGIDDGLDVEIEVVAAVRSGSHQP
jgi:Xaa-Pro aminopeptidase